MILSHNVAQGNWQARKKLQEFSKWPSCTQKLSNAVTVIFKMALMYSKTEQCSYSNFQNGPHVLKNWAMLQWVSVKFSAGCLHCLMGGLLANQWHYVLSVSLSLYFTVMFPCSDVVVQIVDARNPLLFWCPDLDKYVQEVDPQKQTLLLINKADLLSANQRLVLTCQKTEAGNVVGVWFSGEWESCCDQFG